MKKIGTMQLFGRTLTIDQGRYDNGRIAIALDQGMFGKLTLNIPEAQLPIGCVFVKTWEENEQLRAPALATGLFEDTGERVPCGFCQAEVWRYTPPEKGKA